MGGGQLVARALRKPPRRRRKRLFVRDLFAKPSPLGRVIFARRAAGAAAGERAVPARGGRKLEIRGLEENGGARTAPRTWHPAPTAPEVTTITLHPARLKSEHASASAPSMDRCKWPLRSRELVPTLITTTLCLRSAFPTRGAPAGEVFMLECISRSVAMRGK
jgi:hypothetical protein